MNAKQLEELKTLHKREQNLLKKHKDKEMELRLQLVEHYTRNGNLQVGTNAFPGVKITRSLIYTLDQEMTDLAMILMTPAEQDCIKTKYSLSIAKYNELESSKAIDEILVTKEGAPTVKYA